MPESSPLITLSINRSADGTKATGELNSLCLGFGIFQVWLYMAVFCAVRMFTESDILPGFPYLPEEYGQTVLYSFLIVSGIFLIFIGLTNQLFLKFYVSKRALFCAASLCTVGTVLLYGSSLPGMGYPMAILSGVVMGAGSSLLLVLWGTAFARFQFATIILNTAVAFVVGVAVSIICANWVPSPFSGMVTTLLPLVSAPLLRRLMPKPFYQRQEAPIFHPLPAHKSSFLTRFGIPVFLIGIALGVLRMVCAGDILPSGNLTAQLVSGAACGISIIVFIIAVALTKRDMFWDTLFRCIMPIATLGLACIPLLIGDMSLLASFCTFVGYICIEILMWIFFAGLAQEFRISPIYVFGIGRGLLELGSGIGSASTQGAPMALLTAYTGNLASLALIMLVVLSVGYALLPRYREMKDIVSFDTVPADTPLPIGETTPVIAPAEDTLEHSGEGEAVKDGPEKGGFYRKCEEISAQYMLSRREKEVLFLLAKGHNATFIQDKLCVSKSTAKTHINHIYKKMNIHTQQELLNMVEDRPRKAEAHPAGSHLGGVIPVEEKKAVRAAAAYRKNIFS